MPWCFFCVRAAQLPPDLNGNRTLECLSGCVWCPENHRGGRKGLIPGGSPTKQNEKMQNYVSIAQGGECRDASNVWHCLCAPGTQGKMLRTVLMYQGCSEDVCEAEGG